MIYATTRQAGDAWGCSAATVRKLIGTGVIPGAEQRGVRSVIPIDVVQELAGRPSAPLGALTAEGLVNTSKVPVLRPDVMQGVSEADRSSIGFHAASPAADIRHGLRGWWICTPDAVAAAGIVPVTFADFVVAVLAGLREGAWEQDTDSAGKTRYRFDARLAGYLTDLANPKNEITPSEPDDARLAGMLLGTRLPSHSGGPIAYVDIQAGSSAVNSI
jgi:hypothetical protein